MKSNHFSKTGNFKDFNNDPEIFVQQQSDNGLDIAADFNFNPKKFYCKNHPSAEIEYCNEISGNFYCKMCRSQYAKQDDKVLSTICKDI